MFNKCRAIAAQGPLGKSDELTDLGLGRADFIAGRPERPNILLRLKGTLGKPVLIFCGHMDTKPAGNRAEWKHDPLDPVISQGKLHGLGSADMKSGVAAMVYAAAAVNEVRDHLNGELQLLFTADEEGGSLWGAKYLAGTGQVQGDAILISEPVGIRRELEFIALDSRGVACFRIRVYGDQMHSSLSDEFNAVNASVKAGELMCRLAQDFHRPGATINVGVTLRGSVYFGVVPGLAEFGCDLRVSPGATEDQVRAELDSWLSEQRQRDRALRAELVWESPPSTWISPVTFPRDHRFTCALQGASKRVLGTAPPIGCYPAATDAPWFVAAGVPTIPAFGPGLLPLAHSPNECADITSIFACARIYALAALDYLG